jgi:hypothetical protein
MYNSVYIHRSVIPSRALIGWKISCHSPKYYGFIHKNEALTHRPDPVEQLMVWLFNLIATCRF